MADWMADNLDWSRKQQRMFRDMAADNDVLNDQILQQVFDIGWFNRDVTHEQRMAARRWVAGGTDPYSGEHVTGYIEEEYGYEFDTEFDWDAWREAYGDMVA